MVPNTQNYPGKLKNGEPNKPGPCASGVLRRQQHLCNIFGYIYFFGNALGACVRAGAYLPSPTALVLCSFQRQACQAPACRARDVTLLGKQGCWLSRH